MAECIKNSSKGVPSVHFPDGSTPGGIELAGIMEGWNSGIIKY